MRLNRPSLLLAVLLATAAPSATAEQCPSDTSQVPATVTGTLEYHPGVYAWYGLRPAQPFCAQKVIRVSPGDSRNSAAFRRSHQFIGCEVTANGTLFIPGSGPWYPPMEITDAHLQPGNACKSGEPLPDYSAVPIPSILRRYKVVATYNPKTFDFSAQIYDAFTGKPLSPWQRYATDVGNAGRDLQRMFCADGFSASDPTDPSGQPSLQANVDPDSSDAVEVAIPDSTTIVHLSFVCTRTNLGTIK